MESEPVIDPDSIALPQTHASSDGSPSITGRKKSPPAPLPLDNLQRLAALRRRKPPGSSFKDAGANNRRGSRTFSIVQEDDKDEDRDAVVLDRPLRTDSLDTVASLSASISTLPSTSTGITTPAAIATTFAEPHFYDSSDVYPHRSTSIPIRGIHNLDPLRTASIDSDISLTGTTFYDPFVPRNMRRIKHPTFPIRGPQRQDSIDVPPLPPSSLRRESLPPISPQAPHPHDAEEEHPPRRLSEAGDSDAAPVNSQSSPHTPASSPELSVAVRSVRSQSATVLLEAPAQVPHSDHFPDDSVVEDVCCHILKNVYGKTIDEVDSPGEVWTSVQRCLAELSVIVGTGDEPLMDNPGGPSSAGGNAGGGVGGGGNTNPTRKRPNPQDHHDHGNSPDDGEDYNGYGKPPGDGEDDEDEDHGPTKKARTGEEPDFKISCPFRKRNPLRFNVRDHYECAGKSFPTISSLKRHIKIFHKIKQAPGSQLTCSRCHAAMGSREELEAHLQVPREQICAPVPSEPNPYANPEDGINKATELQLNVRKNNTKVDSWDGVWKTLFPHDAEDDIPTPEFHPPIDLEEIHHDFLTSFHEGQPQGRLGLQLLRYPGLNHAIQLDIAANSTAECRDFINEVFATCRQKHGDANGSPPRRRRSNRNPNSSGTTRPPSHEPHSPLRQRGLPALQPPGLGQDLHPITTRGATGMLPQPLQSVPATPVSLPSAGSSHMVSFHGSSNMGFSHSGGPTDFIDFASGQLSPEQQQPQQRHRTQPQRPQEQPQHQNQHRQPQFNHATLGMTPGMLPGHPDLPYHLDQRLGPQYQLGGNGMNTAYPTSIEEDLGSGYVTGFESSASLPFLRDNMSYYPTATTVATSHGMMSVPGGSGASLQGTAGGGIPGALLHEDASSGRQSRGSGSRLSSEWSEIQGVPPASGFSTDQPGR